MPTGPPVHRPLRLSPSSPSGLTTPGEAGHSPARAKGAPEFVGSQQSDRQQGEAARPDTNAEIEIIHPLIIRGAKRTKSVAHYPQDLDRCRPAHDEKYAGQDEDDHRHRQQDRKAGGAGLEPGEGLLTQLRG